MVTAPAKKEEKEKSIILYTTSFRKKNSCLDDPVLAGRENVCLILKHTNDGTKIYTTSFPQPHDICLQQAAAAISGSCLYVLGGKGCAGITSNRIHCLDTLNPADGWKTLDHCLPFCYDSAAVEVMGNLIFLFPNSQPFKPLDQKSLDSQNLWGYAYDTVKGSGYPIEPPTQDLIGSVVEHCGGFTRYREVVVPTASSVYTYDTLRKSWGSPGRYGPFQGFKGHSTFSNGIFYRCDPYSFENCWALHIYHGLMNHVLHMRLPKLDFMSEYSGNMFLVPLDDSKLCILWQKKFDTIGKSNLCYCKIKLSFDPSPFATTSPSATILEQNRFENLDIWDLVNCLPIDSIRTSHLEEIRPLSRIDLFDNKVRVDKVTSMYPGMNYRRIGEKHQPRNPFSSRGYSQSPDPLISSGSNLLRYKGYMNRGIRFFQMLFK